MNKNTMIANLFTMGGIGACLAIAQLPIWYSAAVLVASGVGCAYLTSKGK